MLCEGNGGLPGRLSRWELNNATVEVVLVYMTQERRCELMFYAVVSELNLSEHKHAHALTKSCEVSK